MRQVRYHPSVTKFIAQLEPSQTAKVVRVINLLQEYGLQIRSPHSKKLTGYKNLFELRTSGESPVRLLYTPLDQEFIVLHAFTKKTDKTPTKEINTAISRIPPVDKTH